VQHKHSGGVKTCVNDSIASGGGGKKSDAAYSRVWGRERRGAERGGEEKGEEREGGGGLRCGSAHTGYFIEGNKRALRTEV